MLGNPMKLAEIVLALFLLLAIFVSFYFLLGGLA